MYHLATLIGIRSHKEASQFLPRICKYDRVGQRPHVVSDSNAVRSFTHMYIHMYIFCAIGNLRYRNAVFQWALFQVKHALPNFTNWLVGWLVGQFGQFGYVRLVQVRLFWPIVQQNIGSEIGGQDRLSEHDCLWTWSFECMYICMYACMYDALIIHSRLRSIVITYPTTQPGANSTSYEFTTTTPALK
jgi:hypothetical protein